MVATDLRIPFPLVKVDYGCILKSSPSSTYSETTLSVSLPWVVPQLYRPRQELYLHLELCQMTVVELSFFVSTTIGNFSKTEHCSLYVEVCRLHPH